MATSSAGQPVNVGDFERLAAEALEAGPHGYFAGGAGDERTLRDNVAAFERIKLLPRMLVDVDTVTTATTVLGTEISMPILVAPVAFQRMAHADGEAGMARAASAAGTIMCLSSLATARPAEVAEGGGDGHRWFQLYCFRDRGVTHALAEEAVASGYEAIALTVDAPRAGRRERDLRAGFTLPPEIRAPGVEAAAGGRSGLSVREVFDLIDPTLTWRDLERLVNEIELPIVVKGVLSHKDARLAADHGAAGVVVSNHGGRQLDGVPASLEALPRVADEVGDEIEVLMDGGVRRGSDVVAALALGARAVLVGRPALWGLAAGGEDGARQVLELLREELELALCLCGCPAPDAVGRQHLFEAPH